MNEAGPSIESLVLGLDYAELETDTAFMNRHESLVHDVYGRLAGAMATETATRLGKLEAEFGDDFQRLNQEQKDFLARPNSDDLSRLRDQFLVESTLLKAVHALDGQRRSKSRANGENDLAHQQDILNDILSALAEGNREGHVELATAGGKSYLIAKLGDVFARAGLRVAVLAPTVPIARQLVGADGHKGFTKFASAETKASLGQQFGGTKAKPSDKVVVSTYQSFNNPDIRKQLGQFDVVLCDEAHRALGEVTSTTIKESYTHAIKLGFTATPSFGVNKSVDEILPTRMHSLNLREAIDSGVVSPAQCLVFKTNEEVTIRDPNYRDFTELELRRLINLKSRNQKAVRFTKDFVEDGRQGIIACVPGANLAHARLLAEQLSQTQIKDKTTGQARNMVARAVGSGIMSRDEQIEVLQAYERGEIDVLTFVNVLGEGWDSQRASFLINACPTTSLVKITQQIGRVIRLKVDGTHAIIVDFIDDVIGKQQMTALHALGEETVNLRKIYGGPTFPDLHPLEAATYLRGILDPELYEQLMASEGQLIADLTLLRRARSWSRTVDYYERLLAKEGLYEDTDLMGVPREAIDAIQEAENHYLLTEQRLPHDDEIIDFFKSTSDFLRSRRDLVESRLAQIRNRYDRIDLAGLMLGQDEFYDPDGFSQYELEIAAGEDSDDYMSPDDYASRRLIGSTMIKALKAELDTRERGVLIARFGLDRNGAKTLDEVGEQIRVQRERVRQIEARAMSKLRHPGAGASPLRDFVRLGSAEISPELSAWHKLLRDFSEESIGLQAVVINSLNSKERQLLLKQAEHYLEPVIKQYLFAIKERPGIAGAPRFELSYTALKRVASGEIDHLIKLLPTEERRMLGELILNVPKRLFYRNSFPESGRELMGGPRHETERQTILSGGSSLSALLANLKLSDEINQLLMKVHKAWRREDPSREVPAPADIATFHRRYGSTITVTDLNYLLTKWRLDPKSPRIARFLEHDSRYHRPQYPFGFPHDSTYVQKEYLSNIVHRLLAEHYGFSHR